MQQKLGGSILFALGCIAALAICATPVMAEPVTYDVLSVSGSGFSASWIHAATGGAMTRDAVTYYGGGDKLWSLGGTILGDRDLTGSGPKVNITGGSMTGTAAGGAAVLGLNPNANIAIAVNGGTVLHDLDNDGRATGFLDTTITQGATTVDVLFFFGDFSFAGAANSMTADALTATLWGNSTTSPTRGTPVAIASDRLGIDLRLKGSPVPEPTSLALMALGAAGIAITRRRRKTRRR